MPAMLEREIKLRFDSPESARAAVERLGATRLRSRRLQSDAVFDMEDQRLRARGQLLRVRIEEGMHSITFKSPAAHPTMKLRDELETSVGDGQLLVAMLTELGFRISFRYEKYREEFALEDVIIAVDETPVGTFVEIEGSDLGIVAAATALGRDPADFVVASYRELFVRWCAEGGVAQTDMVFPRSADR